MHPLISMNQSLLTSLSLSLSLPRSCLSESAVRLPEYQPKTKSLDGFLNKLRSRQNATGSAVCSGRVPPTSATSCLPTPLPSLENTVSDPTQNKLELQPPSSLSFSLLYSQTPTIASGTNNACFPPQALQTVQMPMVHTVHACHSPIKYP